MSRRTWALLLVLYAVAAVTVPLVGYSVPPCLGDAEGDISAACIARWEASMPLFPQRFVHVLGVPLSAVVSFLALTAPTLAVNAALRFRSRSGA